MYPCRHLLASKNMCSKCFDLKITILVSSVYTYNIKYFVKMREYKKKKLSVNAV